MKNLGHLLATLIAVLLGSLLLVGLLSLSSQAAPLSTDGQRCEFERIIITASLGISDTLPSSPLSRTVYFANTTPGVITVTVVLTGLHPGGDLCHLWAGPAFGITESRYYTASVSNSTINLTYPVAVSDLSAPVVITSSWEVTGSMYAGYYHERTLAFIRDVTPPEVTGLAITTTSSYLCPIGTKLYYTNTGGLGVFFWISGESSDEGAGLKKTTFSPWNPLGCGPGFPEEVTTARWSAKYCLSGLPDPGVITATSYDYVGNFTVVAFPYEPDGEPPVSTVTATVAESFGRKPFRIEWSAQDQKCGAGEVDFYYRYGAGGWTLYQTVTVGTETTGFFTFTPPTVWLTGPVTYEFASVAVDRLGNAELLRDAETRVTVHPVRIYLPTVMRNYPPSWKQGIGTAGMQFRSPSGCGVNVWWAGTSANGVWKSTNNAINWNKVVDISSYPYPVVANPNDCNQAFVRVWGDGVYHIKDGTAYPINNNLGDLKVYGLAITGTTLYAGTESQGVYKTAITNIYWQPANNGITEKRIRSLRILGNEIYAGAKNCKLYYSTDGGQSWSEEQVLVDNCEDAPVWSVEKAKNTIYAGLGSNKGLYFKKGSSAWSKVVYIPDKTIFGLAYDKNNDYLYVGTFGAGVYRCWVDENGAIKNCVQHNQGLTTLYIRELEIHGDLLVAGSEDGIWYLPLFK